MSKRATGTLHVEIYLHCPNCDEGLDLFDEDESGVVNDDGQLWELINAKYATHGADCWKNIDIEGLCKYCKKEFIFDEMQY